MLLQFWWNQAFRILFLDESQATTPQADVFVHFRPAVS